MKQNFTLDDLRNSQVLRIPLGPEYDQQSQNSACHDPAAPNSQFQQCYKRPNNEMILKSYLTNTPTTNSVTNIPVALNAIAPMAQADSGRRYTSGIVWQYCLVASGNVPNWHVRHWVSSVGWRIWKERRRKKSYKLRVTGQLKHHTSYKSAPRRISVFLKVKIFSKWELEETLEKQCIILYDIPHHM